MILIPAKKNFSDSRFKLLFVGYICVWSAFETRSMRMILNPILAWKCEDVMKFEARKPTIDRQLYPGKKIRL